MRISRLGTRMRTAGHGGGVLRPDGSVQPEEAGLAVEHLAQRRASSSAWMTLETMFRRLSRGMRSARVPQGLAAGGAQVHLGQHGLQLDVEGVVALLTDDRLDGLGEGGASPHRQGDQV